MAHRRDDLMNAADRLAQQLKYESRDGRRYVSYNELQKLQRFFTRHCSEPDPWAKVLRLLSYRVIRSKNDWDCMRNVLRRYNTGIYSNDELSLILGWTARLLRYYSKQS